MHDLALLLKRDRWMIQNYFKGFRKNPKRLIPFSLYFVWIAVIFGVNRLGITKDGIRPEAVETVGVFSIGLLSLYFVMSLYNITQEKANHFSMGDVNLLFTSPAHPKVILIYTVIIKSVSQMILSFLTLILLMPNLLSSGVPASNLWLGMVGYFSFVICIEPICFIILQLGNRSSVNGWAYGSIALFIGSMFSIAALSGQGILKGLTSPLMYKLPMIGWSRVIYMSMYTGITKDTLMYGFYQLTLFVCLLATVFYLGNDYYEDVLASSERIASLKKYASNKRRAKRFEFHFVKKKKVDVKSVGEGINAFYWKDKVIRNRTDFHHTITVSTFVLVTLGVLIGFNHSTFDTSWPIIYIANGLLVYILLLGSISGTLEMEMDKHFFYVIPGNAFKKLIAVNKLALRKVLVNTLLFNSIIFILGGANDRDTLLMILFTNSAYFLIKISSYLVRMIFRNPKDFTLMLPLMKMIQIMFLMVPMVVTGLLLTLIFESIVIGIIGIVIVNLICCGIMLVVGQWLSGRLELI